MAQRFGGKYSPRSNVADELIEPRSFQGARVDPVGARANLMFVPPVVLALMSLGGGAYGLILGLAGAGVLSLAAWLLRHGLRAEAAFRERKMARRPALPRKSAAALLTGLGTTLAVMSHHGGLLAPILFGVAACALHLASFGLDPLRDKGMDDAARLQHDRVARVVDEADAYLSAMSAALVPLRDRALTSQFDRFQQNARALIQAVEDDPRDLGAARKYLGVYLQGARDATTKFVEISGRDPSSKAREDYRALLVDLEENFAAKTEKLLQNDHRDLNIEIDVLRERLKREGVRIDAPSSD